MTPPTATTKMQKQESTATINGYVKQFMAYARANNLEYNTDAIVNWDNAENGAKMGAALRHKYGEKAIYEIGLRELYSRFLFSYSTIRLKPASSNPVGLKKAGPPVCLIQKKVYVPDATKDQKAYIIAEQKQKLKNAAYKLAVYEVDRKVLIALIDEALSEV